MEDTFDLCAPTGEEILGTYETVLGAAELHFTVADGSDYDHAGETEMFWDTSTTKTIDGAPLFTDRDGRDWLAHHLMPADQPPRDDETLRLIAIELRIGEKMEAARGIYDALAHDKSGDASDETRAMASHVFHRLKAAYDDAKAAALGIAPPDIDPDLIGERDEAPACEHCGEALTSNPCANCNGFNEGAA